MVKTHPPVEDPIADRPSSVSAWNIANGLTVIRLLLIPVFIVVLFHGSGHLTGWRIAAWAVFAVASITDRFDGDMWDAVERSYSYLVGNGLSVGTK